MEEPKKDDHILEIQSVFITIEEFCNMISKRQEEQEIKSEEKEEVNNGNN